MVKTKEVKRVRVETDGTGKNTHVFFGDEEIAVSHVAFAITMTRDGRTHRRLEIVVHDFDAKVGGQWLLVGQPFDPEQPPGLPPQEE